MAATRSSHDRDHAPFVRRLWKRTIAAPRTPQDPANLSRPGDSRVAANSARQRTDSCIARRVMGLLEGRSYMSLDTHRRRNS